MKRALAVCLLVILSRISLSGCKKAIKSLGNVWKQAIERETISFWLNQVSPVFVVVYDEADDSCY